jgi:hypothetical protein
MAAETAVSGVRRGHLKGVTMKMYIRTMIAFASFMVLAGVSPATAQFHELRARVPFEFTIGETTLPRGNYEVSRSTHEGAFMVLGARRGVFLFGYKAGSGEEAETPRLVFHRYEDQYFLREIKFVDGRRLDLRESELEREAAEQLGVRLAADFETVVIVAHLP